VDWRKGRRRHCVRCGEAIDDDPHYIHECAPGFGPRPGWVVVGPESGDNRRRCDEKWIHKTVYRFQRAGIPVYVKAVTDARGNVEADVKKFPPHLAVQDYPWDHDPEPVEQQTLF